MAIKINDPTTNVSGTSFVDSIDISYRELVNALGEPTAADGYKEDAMWTLEDEEGTVAIIYNYKDGKNYCGSSGLAVQRIRDWHIGGVTRAKSAELVRRALSACVDKKTLDEPSQLTTDMKKEYLSAGGLQCPYCKSPNISADTFECDGGKGSQPVVCEECNRTWVDTYRLTGVQ